MKVGKEHADDLDGGHCSHADALFAAVLIEVMSGCCMWYVWLVHDLV